MKFLITILSLQLVVLSAQAKATMQCKVSDKASSVVLVPPSEQETYLNEGKFKGLDITVIENGAGDSYTVNVNEGSELLVAATIPFYVDANLKFNHKNNLITVICEK